LKILPLGEAGPPQYCGVDGGCSLGVIPPPTPPVAPQYCGAGRGLQPPPGEESYFRILPNPPFHKLYLFQH